MCPIFDIYSKITHFEGVLAKVFTQLSKTLRILHLHNSSQYLMLLSDAFYIYFLFSRIIIQAPGLLSVSIKKKPDTFGTQPNKARRWALVKQFTKRRTMISPHYYKLLLRSENKDSLSKVQAKCGSVALDVAADHRSSKEIINKCGCFATVVNRRTAQSPSAQAHFDLNYTCIE